MSRDILKLMTDDDILEGMEIRLKTEGFNEKTIKDLLGGAKIIMDACTRTELYEVVFAEEPEKRIRPFIDSIFPYMSFNKIGWYGVALRILGDCIRELSANELNEDDIRMLNRLEHGEAQAEQKTKNPARVNGGAAYPADAPQEDNRSIAAKKAARRLALPFPDAGDALDILDMLHHDEEVLSKNRRIENLLKTVGYENKDYNAVYQKVDLMISMFGPVGVNKASLARQIVACRIDDRIKNGDEDAVTVLTWTLHDDNHKDLYLFSVRYCAAHNPKKFPYFNAATVRAMKYCRDNHGFYNFSNDELLSYPKYKKLLAIFREKYDLKELSLSEMSWVLTVSGKLLAGK